MQIRAADEDDHAGIEAVLKAAFPGPEEARLVVALRAADADTLELVAVSGDRVVGTVMFSPATAYFDDGREAFGLGLGPVAVLPEHQNKGVGAALCEAGLDYVRQLGAPFCIVLGSPDYYPRFGFRPTREKAWAWEGDPEGQFADAFQWMPLNDTPLPDGPARLAYHPAFGAV